MLTLALTASLMPLMIQGATFARPEPSLLGPAVNLGGHLLQEDRTAALKDLDYLLGNQPSNLLFLATRARLRESDGNLRGAAEDYTALLKVNAVAPWAYERRERCLQLARFGKQYLQFLLASARRTRGDLFCKFGTDAERCGEPGRHLLLHLLDDYLVQHPADTCAQGLRGLIRHADGRIDEAIQDYSAFLWSEPLDAHVHGLRAQAREAQGDLQGAVADARQCVLLAPDYIWGQRTLASLLLKTREFHEANTAINRAIALGDEDAATFLTRGLIRARLFDRRGGIQDFSKAMELGYEDAGSIRCVLMALEGDLTGALADANKSLDRNWCWLTLYHRAIVHSLRGDVFESIADLLASMQHGMLVPAPRITDFQSQFDLAFRFDQSELLGGIQLSQFYLNEMVAYTLAGKRKKASDYLEHCPILQCDWYAAHAARGLFHLTGGDYVLAFAQLRQCLRSQGSISNGVIPLGVSITEEASPVAPNRPAVGSLAEYLNSDSTSTNSRDLTKSFPVGTKPPPKDNPR